MPHRRSLTMQRINRENYISLVRRIRAENNRMLLRRCRCYILEITTTMESDAYGRELIPTKRNNVLTTKQYLLDNYISDEES